LLAAGVGERLGEVSGNRPKVLLEFGGRTLLARHMDALRASGVAGLDIVTGYRADLIEAELDALGAAGYARIVPNPDFTEGSVVSLWRAREALTHGGDVLLMDGDVLYDRRILARLVDTGIANCFLMDRDFEPGDEPVKLCVRDGRLVEFRKKVAGTFDLRGESVGFFRFSPDVARRIAAAAGGYVDAGRREEPYEEVLRDVLLAAAPDAFGYEDVTGLPWIEIDYPGDVERAAREVLPRILEAGPARGETKAAP
jgi:choline kinase